MLINRGQEKGKLTGKAAGFLVLLTLIWLALVPSRSDAAPIIDYIASMQNHTGMIVDTRPAPICQKASLAGARCLPARDFFAANKRLANFSGILWLLGTSGLTGSEHVLVVGDKSSAKEAIAALLLLAGQNRVSILTTPLAAVAKENLVPGNARSNTREEVFQAEMRSERIVLGSELASFIRSPNPPVLLDGRKEAEYWGGAIRARRGGHIPGALHQPLQMPQNDQSNQLTFTIDHQELSIAYGHDSYESLVYLARLEAFNMPARFLLQGWAGWAGNGALPVDAVSFDQRAFDKSRATNPSPVTKINSGQSSRPNWSKIAGFSLAGIALAVGGFVVGRRFYLPGGNA